MKEFKLLDKLYIAKNVNSKTLEDMSSYLECKPHEVKACFNAMQVSGEYERLRNSTYYEVKNMEENSNSEIALKHTKSLVDLNQLLYSQLEKLDNTEFKPDELERELNKTKAMVSISQTMINNAKVLLDADKHYNTQSKLIQGVLATGDTDVIQ